MGKQINYYMGFKDFIKVAQFALDLGCVICREENKKIICSNHIDIVTPSVKRYFFYLPEAGELRVRTENRRKEIGGYNASGNVLIEAGFSYVKHDRKTITRGRLFSITGYYDESGNWMGRPECVKKAYDKIARKVKKTAPFTEIAEIITDFSTDDYGQTEWKRKEYISPELLELKMRKGYKLSL